MSASRSDLRRAQEDHDPVGTRPPDPPERGWRASGLLLPDGGSVFESRYINEWIEAKHPEPPLIPEGADARLAVKRFEVGLRSPWGKPRTSTASSRR